MEEFEIEFEKSLNEFDIEFEKSLNEFEVNVEDTIKEVHTDKHDELRNRDMANQHPISAITGLEETLNNCADSAITNDYILKMFK